MIILNFYVDQFLLVIFSFFKAVNLFFSYNTDGDFLFDQYYNIWYFWWVLKFFSLRIFYLHKGRLRAFYYWYRIYYKKNYWIPLKKEIEYRKKKKWVFHVVFFHIINFNFSVFPNFIRDKSVQSAFFDLFSILFFDFFKYYIPYFFKEIKLVLKFYLRFYFWFIIFLERSFHFIRFFFFFRGYFFFFFKFFYFFFKILFILVLVLFLFSFFFFDYLAFFFDNNFLGFYRYHFKTDIDFDCFVEGFAVDEVNNHVVGFYELFFYDKKNGNLNFFFDFFIPIIFDCFYYFFKYIITWHLDIFFNSFFFFFFFEIFMLYNIYYFFKFSYWIYKHYKKKFLL